MKRISLLSYLLFIGISHCFSQSFTGLPPGFGSSVRSLFYDDTSDILYAGGNFSDFSNGTMISHIAQWNGSQWDSLGPGINGNVYSIINFNGEIYAGGSFYGSGSINSRGIAKWNGNNWQPFGAINNTPSYSTVWLLTVHNNELYVLGNYDSIGNMLPNGIAKFDGQNWYTFPILDPSGFFNAAVFYNNELYVGGNFNGGIGLADIAKFDGSGWVSVGGGLSGPASSITDMKIYQNKLYVVGNLLTAQGDPGNGIAIWDGNSWSQAGSGLLPSTVQRMYEFQGELYAGGAILSAGGIPVNLLAKWNGYNWFATGGNFDNVVTDFASSGNDLFIGGAFWAVNNDSVYSIVKYHVPVGLQEAHHIRLSIGPNPANHLIRLDYPEWDDPVNLEITDLSGKVIFAYKNICLHNYELNISNFSTGIYILHLESQNLNYRKKLVFSGE